MSQYDAALAELHRAPHGQFVSERKRLAEQLAAGGDKGAGALLAKRARPSVSAWAANQLYWQARTDFDELLEAAARMRRGELEATGAHRKAMAKLVARATALLAEAGHAASETTLRRVSATLAALAAAGGFEPDAPGTLSSDRDPPGFDAVGLEAMAVTPKATPKAENGEATSKDATREARAAEAAEKRRAAEEEARAKVERRRLLGLLHTAQAEVEKLTRERDERKHDYEQAEAKLERAREAVSEFESRLAGA